MATGVTSRNTSGDADITSCPSIRNSPPDNAPITVFNPACTMALVDDNQSMWQTGSKLGIYDTFTFSDVEVF